MLAIRENLGWGPNLAINFMDNSTAAKVSPKHSAAGILNLLEITREIKSSGNAKYRSHLGLVILIFNLIE